MQQDNAPGVMHRERSNSIVLREPWHVITSLQVERHWSRALEEGYTAE
jgi:hypothetical protein